MLSIPSAAGNGFARRADRFGIANDDALVDAPQAACFHRLRCLNATDYEAYAGERAAAEVPLYKTTYLAGGNVWPRRRTMD
jgi:hypothetical protein